MSNTLLKSEVITKMIDEQMKGNEKLMSLASDLGNLPNGVQAGDTFSIVKVAHLEEMVDLSKGDPIPLEDIKVTKSPETIEHKAKGFTLFDIERETTIGGKSIIDLKTNDLAKLRVRAIEKSLGSKLANAPLQYPMGNKDSVTSTELNIGMQYAFGDAQDYTDFAGIVINSRTALSFYTMDEFVKTDLTYTRENSGIMSNGIIGYFRGIPVIVSDVATFDKDKDEFRRAVLDNVKRLKDHFQQETVTVIVNDWGRVSMKRFVKPEDFDEEE